MKKWVLVKCIVRDFSILGAYNTKEDAQDAMVEDFLSATRYSNPDDFNKAYDGFKQNALITDESAWCISETDGYIDWAIFSIDIGIYPDMLLIISGTTLCPRKKQP